MEDSKNKSRIIPFSQLVIGVIIIWIISAAISWFTFSDWTKSGPFGDTFGAINSLFSGLALSGIIYTIFLQKIELNLQRKELKYTRKELRRTANAQEDSVKMFNEQLRLSNLPFLQYNSKVINGENCLIISNESDHPAFDIDIWLFVTESDDDYPFETFIEDWVKDDYKFLAKSKKLIDEQIWGISERGVYHSFPKSKKILIPIDYVIGNNSFEIYVQYRDNLNNNYSQSIWFHSQGDGLKPFHDSIYKPNIPTVTDRIDLTDKNITEDNLPEVAKGLIDLYNASVFGSRLKNRKFRGVEYHWEMKEA